MAGHQRLCEKSIRNILYEVDGSEHEEESDDLLADPDFVSPEETDEEDHVSLGEEENDELQVSDNELSDEVDSVEQEVYTSRNGTEWRKQPYSQSRVRYVQHIIHELLLLHLHYV